MYKSATHFFIVRSRWINDATYVMQIQYLICIICTKRHILDLVFVNIYIPMKQRILTHLRHYQDKFRIGIFQTLFSHRRQFQTLLSQTLLLFQTYNFKTGYFRTLLWRIRRFSLHYRHRFLSRHQFRIQQRIYQWMIRIDLSRYKYPVLEKELLTRLMKFLFYINQ